MYRQFNIQQFYVLPTHCIYVFCVDLRTDSDYFPFICEVVISSHINTLKCKIYLCCIPRSEHCVALLYKPVS